MLSTEQAILALVPKTCPACAAPTELLPDAQGNPYGHLRCTSPSCPAKAARRFEIAAKNLDLKFFGPSVCELLAKRFPALHMFLAALAANPTAAEECGVSAGVAARLTAEVERAREKGLDEWRFVAAAQPDRVGESTARLLADHFGDAEALLRPENLAWEKVQEAAGRVGPELAATIASSLKDRGPEIIAYRSMFTGRARPATKTQGAALAGQQLCITGNIPGVTRQQAVAYVESHGGKYVNSVSRNTTILVTEDTTSGTSKNQSARKFGTKILTWRELLAMVGDSAPEQPEPEEKAGFNLSADGDL